MAAAAAAAFGPTPPSPAAADESRRAYLERTVARLLREGLAHVLEEVALAHVDLASGKLWDADGYLPARFRAPDPVRMLGEWLRERAPRSPPAGFDPSALDWDAGVPWAQLGLREQALVAFRHLDEDGSGFVQRERAIALAHAMGASTAAVRRAAAELELELNAFVTADELEALVAAVAPDAKHPDFGLRPIVAAFALASRPREEQVGCAWRADCTPEAGATAATEGSGSGQSARHPQQV